MDFLLPQVSCFPEPWGMQAQLKVSSYGLFPAAAAAGGRGCIRSMTISLDVVVWLLTATVMPLYLPAADTLSSQVCM